MSVTRLFVRPAVRHKLVFCQNGYTYPQTFSASGCHTILVFPYQTVWQYSDGDTINGGVECKAGMKKNRYFRPIFRFISEIIQNAAIVTMDGE